MNERIYEQARQYANENYPGSFVKYNPEWFAFYNKKFAELLVRECANYAYSDDQDHKAMLKHFGVRE